MENASKALLMAAGVLIGILTLSLAVYLFVSFGTTSAEIYKKNEENQLNEFNTKFTSYVGRNDLTIHDVISVANLATENNIFYELPKTTATGKDNYISVHLKGKGSIEFGYQEGRKSSDINSQYNEYIKDDIIKNQTLPQYKCTVEISPTTKRVFRVEFE